MFKVCGAEIKKILSKPGIYILSVLLAIILILGVFAYQPTKVKNENITLNGITFQEKYQESFIGDKATYGKKLEADTMVADAISLVNNYTINTTAGETTYYKYIVGDESSTDSLLYIFNSKINSYRNCSSNSATDSIITTEKNAVLTALSNLNTALDDALTKSSHGSYLALTTETNRKEYLKLYQDIYDLFSPSVAKDKISGLCKKYDTEYKKQFEKVLNDYKFPYATKKLISNYTTLNKGSKYATLTARLEKINKEIEETKAVATDEKKYAKEMDRLANLYINTCKTYANLVKYELICNAFDYVSTGEQLDVMYLKDYSKYNSNSLLARYTYLFDNNKTENDFARPLTIGSTSNYETNAYDYAHFVLKLFSFVIIVFAIMTACQSIAGEIKDGTMRYFAIRPVSRTEIYFGKFLAILALSALLMLFSGIIAICVGGTVYGFSSQTILTIFNGTTPITLHPVGMIIISMLSIFIELIIYMSIALLLANLIKSDLASVTIVMVLYILNILLPVFVNGFNTWLSFYPFSHINLYSLFGSSLYLTNNNFFSLLLGVKVYASTTLPLTIILIILISLVTNLLSVLKFNSKEL